MSELSNCFVPGLVALCLLILHLDLGNISSSTRSIRSTSLVTNPDDLSSSASFSVTLQLRCSRVLSSCYCLCFILPCHESLLSVLDFIRSYVFYTSHVKLREDVYICKCLAPPKSPHVAGKLSLSLLSFSLRMLLKLCQFN